MGIDRQHPAMVVKNKAQLINGGLNMIDDKDWKILRVLHRLFAYIQGQLEERKEKIKGKPLVIIEKVYIMSKRL